MLKIFSWVFCILSIIIGFGFGIYAIIAIPKFEQIFKDLNVQLPIITQFVMNLGRHNLIIYGIILLVFNLVLEIFQNGKVWKLVINIILFVAILITLAIIVIGIFHPLLEIIRNLSTNTMEKI